MTTFPRPLRLALVWVVLLAGCARATATSAAWSHQLPPAEAQVGTDTLTIHHGGEELFRALRDLIDHARIEVDVEMYEFGRTDLATALVGAAHRGVAVHVIVDPTVDVSVVTAARLRAAGVDVLEYPVHPRMIDHVKLTVVDGSIAVVGGVNWGVRSAANHDVDAVVRGPMVRNLQQMFARDLVTCGRSVVIPEAVPDPGVIVGATRPAAEIRPLVVATIDGATQTLNVPLYVLTDTAATSALVVAQSRGVVVRVLLDPSELSISRPAEQRLLAGAVAVRVYQSRGELLHEKAAIADGSAVVFGSANWSLSGFEANHEIDVAMPNAPAVAAVLDAQFEADWAAAAPA